MTLFADVPCWVITDCAEGENCPARENPSRNCWEIFGDVDLKAFNICQDCIVYLSRQTISTISSSEMEQIMGKKGIALSVRTYG